LKKGETAKSHAKKIAKNEKRIAELDKIYFSLYEDKALGKISEERFNEISANCNREQEELKNQTSVMQTELDSFNEDTANVEKFVELVKRYTDFTELSATMINEFVDRVVVHEGEWSEGVHSESGRPKGKRSQKIEVYLKYVGSLDVPCSRTPEEIEAERVALEQERYKRKLQYGREWRLKQKEKLLQAEGKIS
jgi:hypothetical protein